MSDVPINFRRNTDGKASDWTPREALMHALVLLGDEPDISRVVIILASVDEEEEATTHIVNCTKNALETRGVVASAMMRLGESE